ncbi:MAG: hypothetical protein H6713_19055 [Myxococcales bacterium]|nr:hypothetical protein [Myxococcales bacterium]
MKLPLEISNKTSLRADAIQERVRARGRALDRFYDLVDDVHVALAEPRRRGGPVLVRVTVTVGEESIVAVNKPAGGASLDAALEEAFADAVSQLKAAEQRLNPARSGANLRRPDFD